ncbi:hypothetical protein GCM10022295_63960 [Streptomyces osmaniensis]|uniref:Uncharacterized protein n=1 Tax=Streptomyces osmaniensis TaxID=593134 RepID=A0ABP6XWK0_9ACTN
MTHETWRLGVPQCPAKGPPENPWPRRPASPYTHHDIVTSEGSQAVREHVAVAAPRSRSFRSEVILVSSSSRCPLRGRHRMPVTNL